MNAVLIAWGLSMIFCAFFTFMIPAWDAYQIRKSNRQAQQSGAETQSLGFRRPSQAT